MALPKYCCSRIYEKVNFVMLQKYWRHGRPQKFFQGGNVGILFMVFRLLTKQCKRTFTKHFTLSKPQQKCAMLGQ